MTKFRATIKLGGNTAIGIQVPEQVVASLRSGKRPRVRRTVAPMGGVYMLPVSAEVRESAGVAAGDTVDVELQLDTEPREVTVPDVVPDDVPDDVPNDVATALNRDAAARQFLRYAIPQQQAEARPLD